LQIHVPLPSGPHCHVLIRADGLRVLRANTGRRMTTGGSTVIGLDEQLTLNGEAEEEVEKEEVEERRKKKK